jgi:hypothetical protein
MWFMEVSQEASNLHVAHVHPCAPMCTHVWITTELILNWKWTKTQLKMNLNLIKNELKVNWK